MTLEEACNVASGDAANRQNCAQALLVLLAHVRLRTNEGLPIDDRLKRLMNVLFGNLSKLVEPIINRSRWAFIEQGDEEVEEVVGQIATRIWEKFTSTPPPLSIQEAEDMHPQQALGWISTLVKNFCIDKNRSLGYGYQGIIVQPNELPEATNLELGPDRIGNWVVVRPPGHNLWTLGVITAVSELQHGRRDISIRVLAKRTGIQAEYIRMYNANPEAIRFLLRPPHRQGTQDKIGQTDFSYGGLSPELLMLLDEIVLEVRLKINMYCRDVPRSLGGRIDTPTLLRIMAEYEPGQHGMYDEIERYIPQEDPITRNTMAQAVNALRRTLSDRLKWQHKAFVEWRRIAETEAIHAAQAYDLEGDSELRASRFIKSFFDAHADA